MSEKNQAVATTASTDVESFKDFTNYSREQIEVVKQTVAVGATDAELKLFLSVCRSSGLNPFARQIYAIKRRVKEGNNWVDRMTIQTGIDGFRVIAERGGYDGQDATLWCGPDGVWKDVWLSSEPPSAAKVTVYRKGVSRGFTGIALFSEYAQTRKTDDGKRYLTGLWGTMPTNQLAKCAEALAHRKAFPQDLSNVYVKEELDQMSNEDASTTGDPTSTDTQRAAQIEAGDKYRVSVKPTVTVDATATPVAETKPTPAEEKPATSGPVTIHRIFNTGSGEKPLPVPDETPADQLTAVKRADELAFETASSHIVKVGDTQVYRADPPAKPVTQQATTAPAEATEEKPKPKVDPARAERIKAMFTEMAAILDIKVIKTASSQFSAFCAGWLGIPAKDVKLADPSTDESLFALECLIRRDREEFGSGPGRAGERLRKYRNGVAEKAASLWPQHPDVQAAAVMLAVKWGLSSEHFTTWVEANSLDFFPEPDVAAALRLFNITRQASTLTRLARAHNTFGMTKIVEQFETRALGKKLEECDQQTVENAITAFKLAVEEAAKPTPKPEAKPEVKPEPTPAPAADPDPPVEQDGFGFEDLLS